MATENSIRIENAEFRPPQVGCALGHATEFSVGKNRTIPIYGERWHSVQFQRNVPHLSRSDVVSLQVIEKQSKKLLCAHVFLIAAAAAPTHISSLISGS
jgi:hypothetical protein